MEKDGFPRELKAEIDGVGESLDEDLLLSGLISKVFSPYQTEVMGVTDKEATEALQAIKDLGYDPDVVIEMNRRRDLDNPLQLSRVKEILIEGKNKERNKEETE